MAVHSIFLSLMTLTFDRDIQTRPSEDQTHVFPVNLAQIRSAVPKTFDSQNEKKQSQTALKTEPCYLIDTNK